MRAVISLLVGLLLASASPADESKDKPNEKSRPGAIEGAQVEIYKTVGDVKLTMSIFDPPGHQPTDHSPAIVFFFGGGWTNGSPAQFAEQCKYLASRGMVAMAADYRVKSRHGVLADSCVRDAKARCAGSAPMPSGWEWIQTASSPRGDRPAGILPRAPE